MKHHVLVVDDDVEFLKSFISHLETKFHIHTSSSLEDAKSKILNNQFDVVIVNFFLMEGEGTEVIDLVNKHMHGTPVIVISSVSPKTIRADCINRGVQFIIRKPVRLNDMSEKIENCIGAAHNQRSLETEILPGIFLDSVTQILIEDGSAVNLTPTEYKFLNFVYENRNRVIGNRELISQIWPKKNMKINNIHVHISNIRKKAPTVGKAITYIRGKGVIWRISLGLSTDIKKIQS